MGPEQSEVVEAEWRQPGWAATVLLAAFALLGPAYVLVLALVATACATGLLYLVHTMANGGGLLILLKVGIPLLLFGWCSARTLLVRTPSPDGIPLAPTDAPRLWSVVRALEQDLQAPPIHRIHLHDQLNAEIGRYPRLGLLGWQENVLFLGMPWLLAGTPEHARAGIAHELAHLSRKHNWTTRLVWRAQSAADRARDSLATTFHSSTLLTGRFFDWYQPALERRAMALSRRHEFEADRLAAAATEPRILGEDLVNSEVWDGLLDLRFWTAIACRYRVGQPCPRNVLQEIRSFLAERVDAADVDVQLKAALARRSGTYSSHPSLRERLAALGVAPVAPDLHGVERAASHFFENRLDAYLDRLSEDWWTTRKAGWERHANALRRWKAEIESLERAAQVDALATDDLAALATLKEKARGRRAASLEDLELLRRNPDHLHAQWRLGYAALDAGHVYGLPLILQVMRRDWQTIPAGCDAIRDAADRGVLALTEDLDTRLDEFEELFDAAEAEFETTSSFDLLEPHGLAAKEVRHLTDVITAIPAIRRAFVVRKRLKTVSGVSGLVVGISARARWTSWLLGTDFGSEWRLAQDLVERIELDDFFVVVPLSENRMLRYRMKRLRGSTLVSRPWRSRPVPQYEAAPATR